MADTVREYMTPYENFRVMQESRRPSGVAIGGLVTAAGAAVIGAAAWAFAGQASKNAERNIDRLSALVLQDHNERILFQNQVVLHNGGYGCGHGYGNGYGYSPLALGATNQPNPIAVTMCEPAHVKHCGC